MERNGRKVVQRHKNDGFVLVSVKGSQDLPTGTARNFADQAGWLKKD